jgi:hypothetical protein
MWDVARLADGETFIHVRLFVYAVSTSDVLVWPSHFGYASWISEHPQVPPNSRTYVKLSRFHRAHYSTTILASQNHTKQPHSRHQAHVRFNLSVACVLGLNLGIRDNGLLRRLAACRVR